VSLGGVKRSYKTSTVAKNGLKLLAGCNQACSVTASLTVSAATARKLHLKTHGNKPVTLASARATLRSAGTRLLTLKLSKSNAKALAKQKRVALTVLLVGTASATHRKQTAKKGVIFIR
jgi:hypothetical protein